ncbi:MAG: hypothetical protein ACW99A_07995 [Candidatus Kariarchaeaceae archaeon]|jgi:hypothetical protein
MALSLLITTLITAIIFLPIGYLLRKDKFDTSKWYGSVSLGAVGWVLYSIISFVPYYYLFTKSSETSYREVIGDNRTTLFFIILFLSIVSEIIRYEIFKSRYFLFKNERYTMTFGIGWGFAEFMTRFLFFFEPEVDNYIISTVLLLIFLIVSNAGLTTILIRSSENTKYVMFATFIKFFIELALFGALGYDLSFSDRFGKLYFFLVVQTIMFYLTMKTKKPELTIDETQVS